MKPIKVLNRRLKIYFQNGPIEETAFLIQSTVDFKVDHVYYSLF